jgi:hypothetical protein
MEIELNQFNFNNILNYVKKLTKIVFMLEVNIFQNCE